eukprot:6019009-Prymnesium_polylepis.1
MVRRISGVPFGEVGQPLVRGRRMRRVGEAVRDSLASPNEWEEPGWLRASVRELERQRRRR